MESQGDLSELSEVIRKELDMQTERREDGIRISRRMISLSSDIIKGLHLKESVETEIKRLNEKSLRFYTLLGEIQNLSGIIQTKRFSFKEISEFRNTEQVKKSINVLTALFPEEREPELD